MNDIDKPRSSPILRIFWLLAGVLCLFTAENIWLEPWVASKAHHRLPSFIPEVMTEAWFLVALLLMITLILTVLCQILLMKDTGLERRTKVLTAIGVVAAIILTAQWFAATGGATVVESLRPQRRDHTVTLHWQASTSKVVGYYVYRGEAKAQHSKKLNPTPLDALTYTDDTALNGKTYYYVVRSVDTHGTESDDSNEVKAEVPRDKSPQ